MLYPMFLGGKLKIGVSRATSHAIVPCDVLHSQEVSLNVFNQPLAVSYDVICSWEVS